MLRPLFSIAPELKSPTATILYWSRSSSSPKRVSSQRIERFRHCIAQPAWSSLPGSTYRKSCFGLPLIEVIRSSRTSSFVGARDEIAVRQQHRILALVGVNRHGITRHHVRPVGEPRDAAEALRLA